MKKFIKFCTWLLPLYALAPIAFGVGLNAIGYFGTQHFIEFNHYYDLSLSVDEKIPFIPAFIYIYIGAYVQWIIGFLVGCRENKEFCYRIMSAETISKLMTIMFFLLLPATIVRPEIMPHNFTERLVKYVYITDPPTNLFPSIHCLESWCCTRIAFKQKKLGSFYKALMAILTILVFGSVVFVKQHMFIDIFGGIIIFELGMLLTKKHDLRRIYSAIDGAVLTFIRFIILIFGKKSEKVTGEN